MVKHFKFKAKAKRGMRKLPRKQPKVNSGWFLWIDPVYGKCLTSEDWSKSPSKDGGVCVRKIWFGVHRLKKKKLSPFVIFRGCKLWRYYESEWSKTYWIKNLKNGTFKTYLENLNKGDLNA